MLTNKMIYSNDKRINQNINKSLTEDLLLTVYDLPLNFSKIYQINNLVDF